MTEEKVEVEICPMCNQKTLTLNEEEKEVPYFGKMFLFSMTCSSCKYNKADVEAAETKEPSKYEFDVTEEKDMKIKVVKSSSATVKIPHVGSMEPGVDSIGFITNIEGLLNKFIEIIKSTMGGEEDKSAKKRAKNLLKKLNKVIWGQEKLKIIIEDPSGNSAILTEKAKKTALKK